MATTYETNDSVEFTGVDERVAVAALQGWMKGWQWLPWTF